MAGRKKGAGKLKKQAAAPKRIMLVDDHPMVSAGVAALLGTEPDLAVCEQAGSAEEALSALSRSVPDLMLLDLALPGTSGIDLLKKLNGDYPELRVLVLSMREESVYAERALRAGAHGYIMKHEPGAKVIEAIRRVLKGELYVSPALESQMLELFVAGAPASGPQDDAERLSDRELQVYALFGKGFSTREIAETLKLSIKTIQTYREHLKVKLGLRNATELVHAATQWVADHDGRV